MKLFDYQNKQADVLTGLLQRTRGAANLSVMGTGKTLVGCEVIRRLGDPVTVVVCPLAAMGAWRRWGKELGVDFELINYDMLRTGRTVYGRWVERKWRNLILQDFEWNKGVQFAIFDEAHRCKGEKTSNGKTLIGAYRAKIPVLLQTATLAEDPLDLKAAGLVLGLYYKDFWAWARQHGCWKSPWGGLKFTSDREKGDRIMAKLHEQIAPRSVRATWQDIPDFPETQIEPLMLDISEPGLVNRLYETMQASLDALQDRSLDDSDPEHPMTQLLRARERLEALKVPLMVEYARDGRAQGMSTILFFNFRANIAKAVAMLEEHEPVVEIVGGQSEAERTEAETRFQTNTVRQLVGQIDAGNLALSLHDLDGGFPRLVLASPSYSGMSMRQLFGRVCRVGGKSKSIQRVALISDSEEEEVAEAFQSKLGRMDILQDSLRDEDLVPRRLRKANLLRKLNQYTT